MITSLKSVVRLYLASNVVSGFVLLLLCASWVQAQNPTQPKRGFYPAGSYAVSDVETINTTNGNVIFKIPLVSLPAGRGGLSTGVGLFYNSKIWETYSTQDGRYEDLSYTTILRPSNSGGWRYGVGYEVEVLERWQESQSIYDGCDDEFLNNYKVKVKFPDGSEHTFRPTGYTDPLGDDYFRFSPDGWYKNCPGQADSHLLTNGMVYYSADGTYMLLKFLPDVDQGPHNPRNNQWILSLPDGTRVEGAETGTPQRIYDRNENFIEIRKITYNNDPDAIEVIDELGRRIVIEHVFSTSRDYIHAWRTDQNGQLTELVWTIVWRGVSVTNRYYGNFNDSIYGVTFGPEGVAPGVSQIILPSQMGNLSYSFDYTDSQPEAYGWGEVTSMTMPSGARVEYSYASQTYGGMAADVLKNYPFEKRLIYQREYDGTSTPVTEVWKYSLTESICEITSPDLGITKEYFFQTNVSTWDSGLVYKTENPDGSVVERFWKRNIPYGYGTSSLPKANPYLKTEYTSVRNAAGALVQTAIKDYTYDKNGNVLQQALYDWVPYYNVHRDGSGKPDGVLPSSPKRVTVSTYYNPTPNADITTFDDDTYTLNTADDIRNAMESTEVRSDFGLTTARSRTEFFYDNASTTGNLIEQKSWDSTKNALTRPLDPGNSVKAVHQYDTHGNRTLTIDAGLTKTRFVYGSVGGFTDLYPTEIKTAFETSIVRTETREYDFRSGLVNSSDGRGQRSLQSDYL